MSELSYLEKLLDGVEVEWKTLGQTCKIETGKLNANAAVDDGEYMFFTTAKETSKIDKFRWDTEALLIAGNANVGEVKHYIGKFEAYQRTYVLTNFDENVSVRFLYFVLSHSLKKYLEERTNSAAMTYIVLSTLENFPIPIPSPDNPEKSLAIQSEIVRILDKFTALTAELTAELNMRKKQYNYYRDQLLSFKDGEVEWKTLGEVAQYSKTRISFELLDERNYVGVDNLLQNRAGKSLSNHVPTSGKLTEFIPNDILIGNIRPYLKKIWQADCIGGTNGDVLVIRCIDSSINTRYLYQILADDKFFEYNMQHAKGAKMPRGSKEDIMKYPIPVPPLTLQARIVEILNKFDTLTNSITEGLPREIELRQKQYEYYRDLLFSFPKPETASN